MESLIEIAVHIKALLTYVLNKCIEKGQFPKSFKQSVILPIYKTIEKQNPRQYHEYQHYHMHLLDLAKAFDTVCHNILLNTLRNIGVRENCFELMNSYLNDRCE